MEDIQISIIPYSLNFRQDIKYKNFEATLSCLMLDKLKCEI